MQWVADNLVWLVLALVLVVVLAGIVSLLVTGVRMYRAMRAAAGELSGAGAVLNERVDRLNAAVEAAPHRAAELGAAVADLRARVAVLAVLHGHFRDVMDAVRDPFHSHIR